MAMANNNSTSTLYCYRKERSYNLYDLGGPKDPWSRLIIHETNKSFYYILEYITGV